MSDKEEQPYIEDPLEHKFIMETAVVKEWMKSGISEDLTYTPELNMVHTGTWNQEVPCNNMPCDNYTRRDDEPYCTRHECIIPIDDESEYNCTLVGKTRIKAWDTQLGIDWNDIRDVRELYYEGQTTIHALVDKMQGIVNWTTQHIERMDVEIATLKKRLES